MILQRNDLISANGYGHKQQYVQFEKTALKWFPTCHSLFFHVWSVHVTLLELWEEFYWSAQADSSGDCAACVEHGKVTKQQQHSNALQTGKVVKNVALLVLANTEVLSTHYIHLKLTLEERCCIIIHMTSIS